jgi:glycosyltransferase involved in cell wall biosynthesis
MIKVIIDPQTFLSQVYGGISKYFTELCTKLEQSKEVNLSFPNLYTDNIHYKESLFYEDSYQKKYAFLIKYSFVFRPFLPRKLKRKTQQYTTRLLQEQDFDLFVPTYYDPYFLPFLSGKPFVLTVHDMIHELYPSYFEDDLETVANKKILIKKAKRIIAVSENTKRDILRIYPSTSEDKIDVIHLAHQFKEQSKQVSHLPEHYILFVGNRGLYKNFCFFLKAVAPLFVQYEEMNLVCAGGGAFDEEEQELINSLNLSSRILQQNFKDAELKSYYENARCFVFPSIYEGFGIPILEAMKAGCPIILTNNSCFPEIAGDAGIYFELDDAMDLRTKVEQVWTTEELRMKHKIMGIDQAKKYSWSDTASKTLEVYKKALKR